MSDVGLWKGLFPATVLPLNEDFSIDEANLRGLVRFLLDVEGVSGLACNGHAGDAWSLTREERVRVVEIHVEEAGRKFPIIAGVSGQSTRDYVEQMRDAKDAGATAVLVTPPPLFKNVSMLGPDIPLTFFRDLSEAVDISIVVFQHPIVYGNNYYSPDTLAKLTEIKNVVAVKESVGDYRMYERDLAALLRAPRRISILTSSDVLLFPCFALGHSDGSLISLGTLMPHWMADMLAAFKRNDIERAREINSRLLDLVHMFYDATGVNNCAFIKEALHMLGVLDKPCVSRPPHRAFTDQDRAAIRRVLEGSGLMDFYQKRVTVVAGSGRQEFPARAPRPNDLGARTHSFG